MSKKIWMLALAATTLSCSDRLADMQTACAGTWELVSRTLPDGSEIRAPRIQGTIHWEPIDSRKAHVSLTIVQNEGEKQVLDHALSLYEISTSAITRKRHVLLQRGYRDRDGAPISHYIRAKTEKGKASVEGANVIYFHAAKGETGVEKGGDEGFKQVYAGNTMMSTYTDGFSDTWKRVQ